MSIKYICDVCGKSFADKKKIKGFYVDGYEAKGFPSVACIWSGDVCDECRRRIEYEMNAAAMREIKVRQLHSEDQA